MTSARRCLGIRVTANGNQLVSYHTEPCITDAGLLLPFSKQGHSVDAFRYSTGCSQY
jgi:hypothetical protein